MRGLPELRPHLELEAEGLRQIRGKSRTKRFTLNEGQFIFKPLVNHLKGRKQHDSCPVSYTLV